MRRRSCRIRPAATLLATTAVILLLTSSYALADVVSYEATATPDRSGWDIVQIWCDPDLWIEDGWFFEDFQICEDVEPPVGAGAVYRRSLADFIGVDTFFVEWVVETTADRSEIGVGGGAALAAGSHGGVNYTFFIVRDQAKLNRDNTLPIIFVDLEPGVPHHYRLALFGAALYVWYVDGEVVDSGVPEGPYPSVNPKITLYARGRYLPNFTKWDYVRYGIIPDNASADFNSDDQVDADDLYYFQECLTTEAGGWTGCAWADMDFSGSVDCDDWFLFLAAWTDPADPPCMLGCDCHPADFNGDGSVNAFDLALLLGSWGPCPDPPADCPADLDGDGAVNAFDLAILLGSWG